MIHSQSIILILKGTALVRAVSKWTFCYHESWWTLCDPANHFQPGLWWSPSSAGLAGDKALIEADRILIDMQGMLQTSIPRPVANKEVLLPHNLLGSRGLRQFHLSGSAIHSTCSLSCRIRPTQLHISSVAVFSSHHLVLVSPKFGGCSSTWTEPSTTASIRFSSETQTLPHCAKPQLPSRTSSILGFYYNGVFTYTNLLHPTSLQRSQDPKLLRLNSITPSCLQT